MAGGAAPEPFSLGIVVPMLNEAAAIVDTLQPLQPLRGAELEVLVVDGGSDDEGVTLAAPLADRVLHAPRGRAQQMNAGAAASRAQVLIFLHADTRLVAAHVVALRHAMRAQPREWGRFDVSLSGAGRVFRLIEFCMNHRSRLTGIATGDQAIFVRRAVFESLGGFPEQPLMEDIELSRRLRRRGRPLCLASPKLPTSSRRWEDHGVWRTVLLMWALRGGYALGVTPARLRRFYQDHGR